MNDRRPTLWLVGLWIYVILREVHSGTETSDEIEDSYRRLNAEYFEAEVPNDFGM